MIPRAAVLALAVLVPMQASAWPCQVCRYSDVDICGQTVTTAWCMDAPYHPAASDTCFELMTPVTCPDGAVYMINTICVIGATCEIWPSLKADAARDVPACVKSKRGDLLPTPSPCLVVLPDGDVLTVRGTDPTPLPAGVP